MCGWGWWKNLEPGDFHFVEFRPDSAIVSYWAILSYLWRASLFWIDAIAAEDWYILLWNLTRREISWVGLPSWTAAPVSHCPFLIGVRLPAKYCGYKRETKTKPLRFQSWRCCSTFLFASWRKRWLGLLAWPFNNTWVSLRSLSMRHERRLCWPCVEVYSSLHCMLGDCGGGASRLAV